jgi:hypothetical protein
MILSSVTGSNAGGDPISWMISCQPHKEAFMLKVHEIVTDIIICYPNKVKDDLIKTFIDSINGMVE